MCTVTYIPHKNRILFSSSRDENPTRTPATLPTLYKGKNNTFIYPEDGAAGGTWIGINSKGNLLILLNGGIVNHYKKTQYRFSRGLVVKQLMDEKDILLFWEQMDLNNIEPFTLVAFISDRLYQLVWTGHHKISTEKNQYQPHIWSSSTLYSMETQTLRQQWFEEFLNKTPHPTSKELQSFLVKHNDPENGFSMNRNELVKTCSISIVEMDLKQTAFEYFDLLNSESTRQIILFDRTLKCTEKYDNNYGSIDTMAVHNNEASG